MGIMEPEEGEVLFKPEHLVKIGRQTAKFINVFDDKENVVKKLFGFAAQIPSFYPELTVVENLKYFGTLYKLPKDILSKNIDTVIRLVALEEDRYTIAGELSGGMQKRLDIACALVHDPNVLILDEPTADLDPVLRNQIWNLIKKINSIGTTIIIASHFIEELEEHCDRIAILHNKSIVETGSPLELRKKLLEKEYIILETTPGDYKKLASNLKKIGINYIEGRGHQLWLHTKRAEPMLKNVIKECERLNERVLDIEIKKSSLREIFDRLLKDEKDIADNKKEL